jgi:hypothetical protein
VADKHPYISGTGAIAGAINQFKKSFPPKVTGETLKKLGIGPNNESYIINILRFIGALDGESNRTPAAAATFSKHDPREFEQAFGEMVKTAYSELFALHGEATWKLDLNKLISFFRGSDKTSDLVGRRQATTFQVLAGFAGHGELPQTKAPSAPKAASDKQAKTKKSGGGEKASPPPPTVQVSAKQAAAPQSRDFGLSVRIEVNLPAAGDQETYDRIFRSIRENLLNDK